MTLEIAEGAVVGDDLEAVAERLEAAAGAVTPVLAGADELAQQRGLLGRAESAPAFGSTRRAGEQLLPGAVGARA